MTVWQGNSQWEFPVAELTANWLVRGEAAIPSFFSLPFLQSRAVVHHTPVPFAGWERKKGPLCSLLVFTELSLYCKKTPFVQRRLLVSESLLDCTFLCSSFDFVFKKMWFKRQVASMARYNDVTTWLQDFLIMEIRRAIQDGGFQMFVFTYCSIIISKLAKITIFLYAL